MKLPVDELRIGMHIEKLDRPWLDTPFLFQGFTITSKEDLEKIRKYCAYVYVKSDFAPPSSARPAVVHAQGTHGIAGRLERLWQSEGRRRPESSQVIGQVTYEQRVAVEQELTKAEGTRREAHEVVDNLYDDLRMGRSFDTGYTKAIIEDLTESVLRSSDAHMLLARLQARDQYAANHCLNVCSLALAFGRFLGMPREQLHNLGLGALLVDVGNIRVPPEILRKRGQLSDEEREIVEQHPIHAMEILLENPDPLPAAAVEAVFTHHERLDGTGYPRGLVGDQIPLLGRIIAIVDVYDATTSDRIYRQGRPPNDALNELYGLRSGKFDAYLVEQFIQCLGIYPVGSVLKCTTGEIGIVISQNERRRLRPRLLLVRDPQGGPYPMPRIVNLSSLPEGSSMDVSKIVRAEDLDIDVADYLRDLSWTKSRPADPE